MADPTIIVQPVVTTVEVSANVIVPPAGPVTLGGVVLAGDLGGTAYAPLVEKIQGTAIQAPPGVNTKFLAGDGSWQSGAGGVQVGGDIGGTNNSPTVIGIHFTVPIGQGGTGQTTQQAAINALAGTQTSGRYLRSDGTNTTLSAIQAADVPTLNQNTTGTANNITGVAAIANGGTGQTTAQAAINALTGTQVSGRYLRSDGTNAALSAIQVADVPTLNQDTTGVASNVSGTVAILHGGTGQTTQQAAINALTGAQSSGKYLRSDGTNATLAAIQVGDVPTLNQNTTGTAAGLSATLAVGSGGTGQTSASAAFNALSPMTTLGDLEYESGASTASRLAGNTSATKNFLTQTGTGSVSAAPAWGTIQSGDVPTLNQNTTGTAANITGVAAIANGGSGQSTQQAAINALTGSQSAGRYLRSDGTNATLASIQVADVPTLNQNTTGTAANITGVAAIVNGGTGQTTQQAAINALTGTQTSGRYLRSDGTNASLSAIAAADLPQATTSAFGAVEYENTVGNLQPAGTPALGSNSKVPDSGHVHPYPAWVFSVLAQGAKGDGKISNTGATNGTTTVTINESVLTSGDVGKVVMVKNALQNQSTAGQTTSVGTITTVNSGTSFTATWNTTPTLTATGLQVLWATDDTVAIQAAIAAANTYAQNHSGYAEVFFPTPAGFYYGVGGTLKSTDGTNAVYNSQLTIPVNAETNNGVTLVFRGPEDAGQTRYWNSDYPVWNGGIQSFGCFTTSGSQSTSITNGGNPSVIGGPTGKFNYGVLQGANTTPTYTNTCVVFRDFTVLTTHVNSGWTYSAFNVFGCARFHAENFAYGTNGVVQFYKNTPNLGDFTNVTLLSGGLSIGGLMPSNGNNASNVLKNVVCNGGYTYGLYATEHTVGNNVTVLYSWSGICPVGSYGDSAGSGTVSALHAMYFDQACVEGCTFHVNIVGTGQSATGPIIHMVLDTEGTVQLRDSEAAGANTGAGLAAALGEIRLVGSPSTVTIQTGTGAGGLGTGLRIIKEQNLPGVPSSGIPTLVDGTSVSNTLWRPATVYLSGGTNVTTVAVSRLAGGVNTVAVSTVVSQAAGALPANTPIRLGPGQWIKVTTSTGTLPTAVWVLD